MQVLLSAMISWPKFNSKVVGGRTEGLASQRADLRDWLAAVTGGDNVSTEVNIILGELWLCLS